MSSVSAMSSPGIGSGLDVNGIVAKLMAIEQQPLTALQRTGSTLQTKLSAMGQLKGLVSALQDSLTSLQKSTTYTQAIAGSSDPSSVAASASGAAALGSYSVSVSTLAAAQTLVSPVGQFSAATDTVGTGSITLQLGTWNAGLTSFTAGSTGPVTIAIDSSSNTLQGIRDKINAANAGVTASIITDSSGARLSLRSTATGLAQGFKVTVSDDDGNNTDALGLSRLAYDPSAAVTQMTSTQVAADTRATINGISVTSSGQTISSAIDGVTLTVNKTTTSPVNIAVSQNTQPIKDLLNQFVTAYNTLNKFIGDETRYDPSTKTGALFQGDGSMQQLQSQMQSMLGALSPASSVFGHLSDIGVQLQKDGSLQINSSKLDSALTTTNLPELAKALTGNGTSPGLLKKFSDWTSSMLSTGGSLDSKSQSLQRQIDSNSKDQQSLADRLDQTQQRLQAEYSSLDTVMAQANSLQTFVNQQVTAWNAMLGSSSGSK